MHVIFVYFVRDSFRTKIKYMRKVQSKSENPQRSATVRKFHAYERSESPGYENWVRAKYSGFTAAEIIIKLKTAEIIIKITLTIMSMCCQESCHLVHTGKSEVFFPFKGTPCSECQAESFQDAWLERLDRLHVEVRVPEGIRQPYSDARAIPSRCQRTSAAWL